MKYHRRIFQDGFRRSSRLSEGALNLGRGGWPSPPPDAENSVGVRAALVARDHARACPAPENPRDCSVGSRRVLFSA